MAKTRYDQAQAVNNPNFLGMVEASVMKVAWDVLQDEAHPDWIQRSALSRLLMGAEAPRALVDSYVRRFAWFVANDPTCKQQSSTTGTFIPRDITDEAIDAAVERFWNTAASVQPPRPEPVEPLSEQVRLFAGPAPLPDVPLDTDESL